MYALETDEGTDRGAGDIGPAGVKLHDLVAVHRPDIGDIDRCRDRTAGAYALARDARIGVTEAGVGKTIAEREERPAAEITIGAMGHRIIFERRQLIDGFVEGDRQAPGGA